VFFVSPYFDHDACMHHAMHVGYVVLDASDNYNTAHLYIHRIQLKLQNSLSYWRTSAPRAQTPSYVHPLPNF